MSAPRFKAGDKVKLKGDDGAWFVQAMWEKYGIVADSRLHPSMARSVFIGDLTLIESSEDMRRKNRNREDNFGNDVNDYLTNIGRLLVSKNQAYGDSALSPIRVFSKADSLEQIRVRIDDKLSRLSRGSEYADEDTIDDLVGYLVLLKIAMNRDVSER